MGNPVPKPKKSKTKSLKQKCIELSGKIATRQGRCAKCGWHGFTDPHHIVPRRYEKTVAITENQIPLCRACHMMAHDYPETFRVHYIDVKFPGRRLMLEAVARVPGKVQWDEVYKKLQDEAKIAGVL